MLALDEMIDGGMIIECDPQQVGAQELLYTDNGISLFFFVSFIFSSYTFSFQVVSRVALRADDIPLGEQTVAQVGNDSKALLSFLFFCFGDRGEITQKCTLYKIVSLITV